MKKFIKIWREDPKRFMELLKEDPHERYIAFLWLNVAIQKGNIAERVMEMEERVG
ncbi:MAG: hypothetical protein UEP78_03365 [Negativibacillus sp.]|nr:hypothetical protein [Negativibacillus sp.]